MRWWLLVLAVFMAATSEHAAAQSKLTIDGSTGTAPLVAALGTAFAAQSGVVVEIGKGLGTKARLDALSGGTIDIAMASHGLNVVEVRASGMDVHRIAMTPVVFATHESVSVTNLSDAQICAVYSGSIFNWEQAGGADMAIVPLARPDSEVDAEVVRAGIGCLKALKLSDAVRILQRAGDMAKALAETAGALGMTSTTVVEQSRGESRPSRSMASFRTYRMRWQAGID